MRSPVVTWLMVGAVLEVLVLAALGVAAALGAMAFDRALDAAAKATFAIVILAVAGAVIAGLLGRPAAPKS